MPPPEIGDGPSRRKLCPRQLQFLLNVRRAATLSRRAFDTVCRLEGTRGCEVSASYLPHDYQTRIEPCGLDRDFSPNGRRCYDAVPVILSPLFTRENKREHDGLHARYADCPPCTLGRALTSLPRLFHLPTTPLDRTTTSISHPILHGYAICCAQTTRTASIPL